MNIYDTKTISCVKCGKFIGEVAYDSEIVLAKCGQCSNPLPEGDNILYTISHYQNKKKGPVLTPPIVKIMN